jgi:hypothetical protein
MRRLAEAVFFIWIHAASQLWGFWQYRDARIVKQPARPVRCNYATVHI